MIPRGGRAWPFGPPVPHPYRRRGVLGIKPLFLAQLSRSGRADEHDLARVPTRPRARKRCTSGGSGSGLSQARLGLRIMPGIATLRANTNATIDATITAISAVRDVTTSRGASQVADATIQDETGSITLTLWGDDIKRFSVGQKIRITDGWVKDFRGKLQISMGRSGKITVQA
jgi:OB-fold nucleic acid binding protein